MSVEIEEALALLPKGRVFLGRYEIVRCLKAGGMGAVYEVIHLETRRRRALKIMLPSVVASPEMHARFRLEATVAADIESEHIVEVFDAGVDADSGAPFLVMELLRGEDLLGVLAKRKCLPPAEVIPILGQAAGALDRTHAAGVVHRDLKPDNLFLARRDDGSPKLKILDFGIAKVVAESGQPAAKTRILGTPLYMSPEQIRGDGDIGPRADLYALGQIAFTLLVGDAYWGAQSRKAELYALMMKIVAGASDPASAMATTYGAELPPAIDAWFARATAIDPADRFSTASELVESLAEVLGVPWTRPSLPEAEPRAPTDARPPDADPAATRPMPDRAKSLTPTTLAPPASARRSDEPSAEEPSASRTSETRREPALRPRRSIAGAVVAVAVLVAAVVLAVRFVAPARSARSSDPASPEGPASSNDLSAPLPRTTSQPGSQASSPPSASASAEVAVTPGEPRSTSAAEPPGAPAIASQPAAPLKPTGVRAAAAPVKPPASSSPSGSPAASAAPAAAPATTKRTLD